MGSQPSHGQCVSAAFPSSRRRHAFGRHCVRSGLIGACGVLAFLFSVVSPYDDDIQQEVIELLKPKQTVLIIFKAPSHIRGLRLKTAPSALIPSAQILVCYAVVEYVSIRGEADQARIVGNRTDDRSPPTDPS